MNITEKGIGEIQPYDNNPRKNDGAVKYVAESHLAVHTFPEEGRTYVEISSCNEDKYNAFISTVNMG